VEVEERRGEEREAKIQNGGEPCMVASPGEGRGVWRAGEG